MADFTRGFSSPVTRRRLLLSAGAIGALAAASRAGVALGADQNVVWGTNADYGKESLFAPFESASGIDVSTELFSDPSELITKLKAGGAGVQVLTDGSYHSQISFDEGVLKPIDTARIANWDHLIPQFRDADGLRFDGRQYGVPFLWGTDSVVYNFETVGGEIDDLGALFDEKYAGQIAMPNGLFESLIVAAMYLGIEKPFAMSAAELEEVSALLIRQKPLVRTYWTDIGDLRNLMATGEVALCWGWKPLLDLRKEGLDVRWANLKQGQLAWYDAVFLTNEVTGDAEPACLDFMNYLIGDTYGALLAQENGYLTTSQLAIDKLEPALVVSLGLDDPDLFLANSLWWGVPNDPAAYQRVWDAVLNA